VAAELNGSAYDGVHILWLAASNDGAEWDSHTVSPMQELTTEEGHELCDAFRTLCDRLRALAGHGRRVEHHSLAAVRAAIVTFCRHAHGRGVCGHEVRRQVGRAMRVALADVYAESGLRRRERVVSRLVDEIYLLGEHRP
jgi:hypothetical protein